MENLARILEEIESKRNDSISFKKKYKSRKIKLEGNFLYDSSLTIFSRVYKGEVGRHVIVPIETKYGWILVNKGFIPEKNYTDYLKKGYSTFIEIEGFIHLPDYKSYFTPENYVNKGEWYYLNIEEIIMLFKLFS